MRHKDVIGMYDNLLRQIEGKVGKKVDIYDPYKSSNLIVKDYEVKQSMIDICKRRKIYWIGGGKW